METRKTPEPARPASLTASGAPAVGQRSSQSFAASFDNHRRQRADEAIAYIERCYRERRPIPTVR